MLILSARCCFSNESNGCKSSSDYSCSLDVTVYGSIEYFETIGSWFQDYEVYLQDPRTCDLDVKYCNPHRLSFEQLDDNPLLSEFVERTTSLIHLQAIGDRPDLLDILNSQNDLEETSQPAFIRSSLHRHQKQALTFMLRRERGWNFYDSGMDIWEIADTSHTRLYINRISEAQQAIEPPEFSGGIIADPMGLGKTLTMISLIATDLQFSAPYHNDSSWELDEENNHPVQATLVVVPQPLLNTWEEELSRHQQEGTIAAFRHHARSKLADISQIKAVNVVLTTYHTLSADWKAVKAGDSNIMFSVRWKRIILDEAHIIRNMKSRLARAVCSLDATSRWAVTGTPIQNHINDLAALLKFIRVHPYDEPKRFEADISRLWKSGDDKEAVERLKRLAGCLILRRSQRTVDLP